MFNCFVVLTVIGRSNFVKLARLENTRDTPDNRER